MTSEKVKAYWKEQGAIEMKNCIIEKLNKINKGDIITDEWYEEKDIWGGDYDLNEIVNMTYFKVKEDLIKEIKQGEHTK